MQRRTQQPWVSGPAELLEHAVFLLREESPVRLRLALIAIDNAVELTVKTYLSLPKRATGIIFPRKRFDEIAESFPALLDALEEFVPDKLKGVDLSSIEWYHRLRNQLYHQGYGLTVEREKVEVYSELANVLFKNLFGEAPLPKRVTTELLGRFIELWPRLEVGLQQIASDHSLTGNRPGAFMNLTRFLRAGHILPDHELDEIEQLRRLRNEIMHGVGDYRTALTEGVVDRLEALVNSLEKATAPLDAGSGLEL